jgi:hypothetical protein
MSLNNCSFSIYGSSPPEKQKQNETVTERDNQICLPFHILVFYMKNCKHGILTEME